VPEGKGPGAIGFKYWTVQLGGAIKKTGRLVPQRSIVTPMRSAVLDKCIDKLLLVFNNVKALFVMGVKLTQGVNWHLNG
tara:strand:- start:771 stop:1007 length:237 start_codon:yes stop_codon:yes gene_type:complete